METYSIRFKNTDSHKIQSLIEFVRSLDFVQSVETFSGVSENKTEDTSTPDDYVTLDVMKARYPNEWVLLAHPKMVGMTVLGGKILLHETDKRTLTIKGKDLIRKYERVIHLYLGEPSKNAHIGLMKKTNPRENTLSVSTAMKI